MGLIIFYLGLVFILAVPLFCCGMTINFIGATLMVIGWILFAFDKKNRKRI